MEGLYLLIGLAVIATFFLPWINMFRINSSNSEIDLLKAELNRLRLLLDHKTDKPLEQLVKEQPAPLAPAPIHLPPQEEEVWDDAPATSTEPLSPATQPLLQEHFDDVFEDTTATDTTKKTETTEEKSGFEWNIGAKLPVWIGAISLACAAFYLVKYSIDAKLLGPTARVILGLLFGGGLVEFGRRLAGRTHIANALRMGQGIIGAGLVSLTFALYSAVHIHHLILPITGFCGMAAVTGATMLLSLRLGQPVAVFGLIGGFLAPALFSSGEENFIGLYGYLFVLYTGMQFVMQRQGWWSLSVLSLCGVMGWSLLSVFGDTFLPNMGYLPLFLLMISGSTIFYSHRASSLTDNTNAPTHPATIQEQGPHMLNALALGGSTLLLLLLQNKFHLGILEMGMAGLMSLGALGLAYLRPSVYGNAIWGKLAADLILVSLFLPSAGDTTALVTIAGFASIYVVLPTYIMQRSGKASERWVITQSAAGFGLYLISYIQLPESQFMVTYGIWGMIAMICAAFAAFQVRGAIRRGAERNAAIYALTTTAFISTGLAIELPHSYLPLAFACEIAAVYWIYQSLSLRFLDTIGKILAVIFAVLSIETIIRYIAFIIPDSGYSQAAISVGKVGLDVVYLNYLPCALALGMAHFLYQRIAKRDTYMSHGLFGGMLLLILAAIHTTIHTLGADNVGATFIMRSIVSLAFALLGLSLLRTLPRYAHYADMTIWAKGLICLTLLRYTFYDLLQFNPFFHGSQLVGDIPLLNGVTLTYGSALLLTLIAARHRFGVDSVGISPMPYKIAGLIFLFVLVTLNVRQFFHGSNLTIGTMENPELYTYSIVWLLTGIGLLAYGMKRNDAPLRLAALGFLTLTIGKVFLIDASELEGLYRIFSFLGLGVSLIGLSMFYTKFMSGKGRAETGHDA